MKKIYLDYAATSPVKKETLEAMLPLMNDNFGNASSVHSFGREARLALAEARGKVADFFNVSSEEVIFTSGGTESDNLAIRGIIANQSLILSRIVANEKPHIITTAIEHHAIIKTCEDLEKQGLAEITYVKPEKNGIVKVEDVIGAIKENTVLISVMYANNEIGTVQPISGIAAALFRHPERPKGAEGSLRGACPERSRRGRDDIIFHTDAVQAVEYLDCDAQKLGCDLMSFSAHKFGGPKGIGGLIVRKGIKIAPQIIGGEQEYHLRAGTENIPGIIGLVAALPAKNSKSKILNPKSCEAGSRSARQITNSKSQILNLRNYFIERVEKEIPKVTLNGDREKRLPNNINFSFVGIEGEGIVLGLDQEGIAASTGSACASKSLEPSHVILALGQEPRLAQGAVRFTFSEKITKEEIDYTIDKLKIIVERLRKMSPFWKGKNNA